MNTQLQKQRRINNCLERVLKSFKQYKLVNTMEEGDIVLIFSENDVEYFEIFLIDDTVKDALKNNELNDFVKLFFIRNKNRRNAKRQAIADISKGRFSKQN